MGKSWCVIKRERRYDRRYPPTISFVAVREDRVPRGAVVVRRGLTREAATDQVRRSAAAYFEAVRW